MINSISTIGIGDTSVNNEKRQTTFAVMGVLGISSSKHAIPGIHVISVKGH